MKATRFQCIGHEEQVDVGTAVRVTSGDRSEQPCSPDIGPVDEAFSQSPDEFAAETSERDQRPSSKVAPVENDQRRAPGNRLVHQTAPHEVFDDGARMARGNTCDSGQLSSGDWLLEPNQRVQQQPAHTRREFEQR